MTHDRNPTTAPLDGPEALTFSLDAPSLAQLPDVPESIHALAAAVLWLAMGAMAMGLVGGALIGA